MFSRRTVLAVLLLSSTEAFQAPSSARLSTRLSLASNNNNNHHDNTELSDNNEAPLVKRRMWKRLVPAVMAATALTVSQQPAQASAPVMALPKAEDRDPITDAMMRQERINQAQAQKDGRTKQEVIH